MVEPRVRQRKRAMDLTTPAPIDESAEGFIFVKRTAYDRKEETEEKIRVPDLMAKLNGGKPAVVRVGGSVTRNLGDFNSARVEVMMELPCLPEISEMRRVADLLSQHLDDLIPQELKKAMGQ
jgi:hypothetical protein